MNLEGDEDHLNLENVHTGKKNSEVLLKVHSLFENTWSFN